MARRSIVVVTAGVSQPSATRLLGDRLAAAAERHLEAAGVDADVTAIEVREHAQDLASNVLTGFPGPELRSAVERVMSADGLIAVTPIFSASYSGLFKMFFDVLERDALAEKPTIVAATGGTARHSLALEHALRPLFAYLSAAVVATAVFAATEDWGDRDGGPDGGLAARIDRAGRELAEAVATRESAVAVDPFAAPTPFEELLRRGS